MESLYPEIERKISPRGTAYKVTGLIRDTYFQHEVDTICTWYSVTAFKSRSYRATFFPTYLFFFEENPEKKQEKQETFPNFEI